MLASQLRMTSAPAVSRKLERDSTINTESLARNPDTECTLIMTQSKQVPGSARTPVVEHILASLKVQAR